jgi:predicted MFS family arabinose efflux permease
MHKSTASAQPSSGAIADAPEQLLSRAYRTRFLAVLLVVSTFNFADRAVFSALGQAVKQDLALTDTQLGVLQGFAFALLYAVGGLPIGWLAERTNRVRIIAIAIGVWSAMTAFCGLAANFWQMLLARVGVGIGEAGYGPPAASLTSDHFEAPRRATALAILALGSPLGAIVGAVGGGWIAHQAANDWRSALLSLGLGDLAGWRAAFLALGVPGLLAGLLVIFLLREPPRGLADNLSAPPKAPALYDVLSTLFAKPAFVHLLIGGAVAGLGLNAIGHFLAPFLGRVHHLDLRSAAVWFGLVSAVSLSAGLLIGSLATDALAKRDRRWSCWGSAIGLVLAAPLYFVGFQQAELAPALAFIFLGAAALLSHFGPLLGMIQNLAPPRMRASASAIAGLAFAIVGVGLGPTLLGVASDFFAARAFAPVDFAIACPGGAAPAGSASELVDACAQASATGMQQAFSAIVVVFVWASVHFLFAARTLREDLYMAAPPQDSAA